MKQSDKTFLQICEESVRRMERKLNEGDPKAPDVVRAMLKLKGEVMRARADELLQEVGQP